MTRKKTNQEQPPEKSHVAAPDASPAIEPSLTDSFGSKSDAQEKEGKQPAENGGRTEESAPVSGKASNSNASTIKGAVIGAVITGLFAIIVNFGPKLFIVPKAAITLASGTYSNGRLELLVRNSGDAGATITSVHIDVKSISPYGSQAAVGGFLPLSMVYVDTHVQLDSHRQTPYSIDIPITQSIEKDSADRFAIEVPSDETSSLLFDTNIWTTIDGQIRSNVISVQMKSYNSKIAAERKHEEIKLLTIFLAQLKQDRLAKDYFKVQIWVDPLMSQKFTIVAIYRDNAGSGNIALLKYDLQSFKTYEEARGVFDSAEAELSNLNVAEYRKLHNLEKMERELILQTLMAREHEMHSFIIDMCQDLVTVFDGWSVIHGKKTKNFLDKIEQYRIQSNQFLGDSLQDLMIENAGLHDEIMAVTQHRKVLADVVFRLEVLKNMLKETVSQKGITPPIVASTEKKTQLEACWYKIRTTEDSFDKLMPNYALLVDEYQRLIAFAEQQWVEGIQKGCSENDRQSCYSVAIAYCNGTGLPKNKDLAKDFFSKACRMGHAQACTMLNSHCQ